MKKCFHLALSGGVSKSKKPGRGKGEEKGESVGKDHKTESGTALNHSAVNRHAILSAVTWSNQGTLVSYGCSYELSNPMQAVRTHPCMTVPV